MTNIGSVERDSALEMSEARFNVNVGEEVDQVTNTILEKAGSAPLAVLELQAPATGFAGFVIRVSTTMLIWAANRANRAAGRALSGCEHARLVHAVAAQRQREQQALLLQARIF